jgi:hypothetical protein
LVAVPDTAADKNIGFLERLTLPPGIEFPFKDFYCIRFYHNIFGKRSFYPVLLRSAVAVDAVMGAASV